MRAPFSRPDSLPGNAEAARLHTGSPFVNEECTMEFNRCYACMRKLNSPGGTCGSCGYDNTAGPAQQPAHALPCGTVLAGHYLTGCVIGQGGFGITYMAWNLALETPVCIKEYFPAGAAVRSLNRNGLVLWGSGESAEQLKTRRESFVKEARKAARLSDLSSIVKVWDVFYENETAYIVMNYIAGETLKNYLVKRGRVLEEEACLGLLLPVMRDLDQVHARGIIHRDIKPDNLMLTPEGSVILLDLGAAKDLSSGSGQSSFLVASQGFTPLEQYNRNGRIGSWTDVYALCATIYYAAAGKLLPTPTERLSGEKIDFGMLSPRLASVLERGLAIQPEDRIQTMAQLCAAFQTAFKTDAPAPVPPPAPAAPERQAERPADAFLAPYEAAARMMEEGSYEDAAVLFEALHDYRDAAARAALCREKTVGTGEGPLPAGESPAEDSPGAVAGNGPASPGRSAGRIPVWIIPAAALALAVLCVCMFFLHAYKDLRPLQILTPGGSTQTAGEDSWAVRRALSDAARCMEEGEYEKALALYQEAAGAGSAAAMTGIGVMYEKGLGTDRDYRTALDWFYRAAEAGEPAAMFWIGWNYYYALGVERSYSTALDWCLKSAEAGNAEAMNWVSDMYRYGQGTSADLEKAEQWRQRAVEAGYAAE